VPRHGERGRLVAWTESAPVVTRTIATDTNERRLALPQDVFRTRFPTAVTIDDSRISLEVAFQADLESGQCEKLC
jgi:hypothetical protein